MTSRLRLPRSMTKTVIASVTGASGLAGTLIAWALFSATSSAQVNSFTAGSIGSGQQPTVTVSGRDVTLSWGSATNATTYTVTRANVAPQSLSTTVNGSCSGSVASTSCTDAGVVENGTAATHWTYTDTPHLNSWNGPTGPASATVTIPGPALGLSTTSFTTAGGNANATVSNFFDNEGVSYCLDVSSTPCGGAQLATDTVPASGGAKTTSVSIPAGLSLGSHVIYAIGSLGSAPSGVTISVTVGPAAKLVFTTQPPASVAAATSFSSGVTLEDAYGNVETGDNSTTVTVAIGTNPGGGTLSGTLTHTVSSGVATFSGLSIDKLGTGYTLAATSNPAHGTATSSAFNVTYQLVFTTQPSTALANSAISPAPVVKVEDGNGTVITTGGGSNASITLSLNQNGNGGSLAGTSTVTATGGVATFSNVSVTAFGSGYTLGASSSTANLTSTTSTAFTVTYQLAFAPQPPANVQANSGFSTVVKVEDGTGTVITSGGGSNASISLALNQNGNSGTLSGTTTVSAVNGVATFSGLSITKLSGASGYTLTASTTTANITSTTSNAITVTYQLVFTTQPPASVQANASFSTVVKIEDGAGTVISSGTGSNASVSLALNQNGNSGVLSGTTTVSALNGVATFSGLSITKLSGASAYTLSASTTTANITSATSNAITVTYQLIFTTQPSNVLANSTISPAVVVKVEDGTGTVISSGTGSNASISLALNQNGNSGTLSGTTTQTASAGVVTFSNLSVSAFGASYTLAASTSTANITGATSSSFTVSYQLVFTTQPPASVQAGSTFSTVVKVEDGPGTVITSGSASTATINMAIGTNPGSGTLSGTTSVIATSGVATFSNLSINNNGVGYTLVASTSTANITSSTSNAFNVTRNLLTFSSCSVSSGGTVTCGNNGTATVTLKKSNQGGGTWTAKVSLTDGNGNIITNTTGSTITVTVTHVTSGATITFSSGTALTIPNGQSQSSNSFTYSNAGVPSGGGSDTVTAASTGWSSAIGAISW